MKRNGMRTGGKIIAVFALALVLALGVAPQTVTVAIAEGVSFSFYNLTEQLSADTTEYVTVECAKIGEGPAIKYLKIQKLSSQYGNNGSLTVYEAVSLAGLKSANTLSVNITGTWTYSGSGETWTLNPTMLTYTNLSNLYRIIKAKYSFSELSAELATGTTRYFSANITAVGESPTIKYLKVVKGTSNTLSVYEADSYENAIHASVASEYIFGSSTYTYGTETWEFIYDTNYNDLSNLYWVKPDPIAVPPKGLTAAYGDTLGDVTLTNPEGNTPGTWTWDDPATSVGDLGEHKFPATFTPEDKSNYNTVQADLTVTVSRRPVTITAASGSWTYDGKAHSDNTVTVTSGNLLAGDALVATATGSVTDVADTAKGNNPVAAGYKVMRGATDVTAKYDITAVDGTLTVNQASGLTVSLKGSGYTYDGTPKAIPNTPTTNAAGGMTSYFYSFAEAGMYVSDLASLTQTDAGSYTIYVSATNPNYSNTATATATLTISKAANPAAVTGTAAVTRGGHTVDLSGNVALNGAKGAVSYAISGEAYGCTLNGSVLTSGAEPGTVTVTVTVAEERNYLAKDAQTIAVTVNDKQAQTVSFAEAAVVKNDGDADFINPAATTGDGAISYEVTAGTDVAAVDAATGSVHILMPGQATIKATAAETATYNAAFSTYTLTVNKADPEPEPPAPEPTTEPISISGAKISIDPQEYTGEAVNPKLTVKVNGKTLKADTDFTVVFKNNKNIGKATATITGKDNYTGTKTATFSIVPKQISSASLKYKKKDNVLVVSWKKAAGGIDGYEIEYGTDKKFKGAKKAKVSAKEKKTEYKIEKPTKKKTWYVRIRSWKKVKGKKYYSEWKVVSKKIK